MSAIDCYKHEVIGFTKNRIALYRLKQDVPNTETSFDGKAGDILLGGGSGESSAMRISIPETIQFMTGNYSQLSEAIQLMTDIFKVFWSPTDGYLFGCEYKKMGWNPDEVPMETWILEHVIAFLLENFSEDYSQYIGDHVLECDGSIFRLPIFEKLNGWC